MVSLSATFKPGIKLKKKKRSFTSNSVEFIENIQPGVGIERSERFFSLFSSFVT